MRGIYLAALAIAALSSCDGDLGRAIEVCSIVCECEEAPVDSIQQQCVDECVIQAGPFIDQIPPACFQCLADNRGRCLAIEASCEDVCDIDDQPVPDPDPIDPPVIIDAGVPPFDTF